jgi:hypothetical protein
MLRGYSTLVLMPLVRCPDCGREISDAAPACVGCGRPAPFVQPAPSYQAPPAAMPPQSPSGATGRISGRTGAYLLVATGVVLASVLGYACWYYSDAQQIPRHQKEYLAANCPDLAWSPQTASSVMDECYSRVGKRQAEKAAVTATAAATGPAATTNAAPAAPPPKPQPATWTGGVGDTGVLGYPDGNGGSRLPVFETREEFDESTKLAVAKDIDGYRELVARAMACPPGTKVRVIETTWSGGLRVRILDGAFTGRSGWVPREWVQPG